MDIAIKGKQSVEFDLILNGNYKIPYTLLLEYFKEYNDLKDYITGDTITLIKTESSLYHIILEYFCDKNHLQRLTKHYHPMYKILDRENFQEEYNILVDMYNSLHNNYKVYEREFVIDNVI